MEVPQQMEKAFNFQDIESPNPLCLLHHYNEEFRPPFNPSLFVDSDEGLIDDLKKVILSAQKDSSFTIRVEGFEVIEDYDTILQLLCEYNEVANKNFEKDNPYKYINLKDTDMRLLVVHYYLAIKDKAERVRGLIGVPRTVDRYYYRINGSTYSVLWQVVDASTYNSATSKSKRPSISLRSLFMAIRVYKYEAKKKYALKDCFTGEEVPCHYFMSYIAKKSLPVMKYILAKFGLHGSEEFFGIGYIDIYDHNPIELENYGHDIYIFNKQCIWITVPKMIFDETPIIQSFVWTLIQSVNKHTTYPRFFSREHWLVSLAMEFNNNMTIEKGLSVLDSLEFMRDLLTLEVIQLPFRDKKDVYCILRWMIGEFNTLQAKDNLDITIKRVQRPLSALYAMKLSNGIYWASDIGKKATITTLKRAVITNPMYLINAISSCQLVNYRNFVNDLDALVALKFTYKGISGMGEKKNSVPTIYRSIHKSHLGIVDLDASSAGDPGISGKFVPYAKIYEHGLLSENYKEPNTWRKELDKVMDNYKALRGRKEGFVAEKQLLGFTHYSDEEAQLLDDTMDVIRILMKDQMENLKYSSLDYITGIPLDDSGMTVYDSIEVVEDDEGTPIVTDLSEEQQVELS